jgi:hypothetical protein
LGFSQVRRARPQADEVPPWPHATTAKPVEAGVIVDGC